MLNCGNINNHTYYIYKNKQGQYNPNTLSLSSPGQEEGSLCTRPNYSLFFSIMLQAKPTSDILVVSYLIELYENYIIILLLHQFTLLAIL